MFAKDASGLFLYPVLDEGEGWIMPVPGLPGSGDSVAKKSAGAFATCGRLSYIALATWLSTAHKPAWRG